MPIMAREAGLSEDDYVLTGQVPDADLVELYRQCRLFVCPSLREGFGLPALEAMACGTPAITSDTTSFPEVVGRVDAMFDPHSTEAISARLATVLGDPGLLAELSRHGLERAKRYSWETTGWKSPRRLRGTARAPESAEPQELELEPDRDTVTPPARRPRLALVGPLPPEPSPVAGWSATLLAELVRHYDVECVTAQSTVLRPACGAGTPVRTPEWLAANWACSTEWSMRWGTEACLPWMLDALRFREQ